MYLELGQLLGYLQHPHILLELTGLVLVTDHHQGFAHLRQAGLNPLEEADRPLPSQLGIVEKTLPLGATRQIALHHIAGVVAGVVVVFGGHQGKAHVRIVGRQQHGGIRTIVGVGVVRLHRQKYLAQVHHPIGPIQIADIGKHAVMFAADDLLAGDAPATVLGVRHPLAGHQLDIAR